ncbi:putative Emp24/Gp25L/p24 protein [Pseudoloma neurophilia]|uniref:Putative Emp24/Gp25L/p24 protein n=1 Tax=Pseudoloma neurophilia TaxID=146866 RepID=A0A0R0LXW9_9MICR|nr:putative Emp24/Gp25L/p24 protein [Pseudoloma neurophilia]
MLILIFSLISSICCLIYPLSATRPLKEFTCNVLANQMMQGSVLAIGGLNCKYAITIESDEDKRAVFHKADVSFDEPNHFIVVNQDPKLYRIFIEAYKIEENVHFEPGKFKFSFNTKFNTFDKDVAKAHAVEPAMKQLLEFEKLLHTTLLKMDVKRNKLLQMIKSQRSLFISVSYLSFFLFLCFFIANVIQLRRAKQFFRSKKLL